MKHQYFLALMGSWMITGGLSLFVAQPAKAGDCGCEVACGCEPACGMEATCGVETDGGCSCEADCGCELTCGLEEVGCGAEQSGCGCEPACEFEPACGLEQSCGCEMGGCDGGCSSRRFNPVYRSLDAVAGGIEKLFGLDKRGQGCGGACGCEAVTSDCGCGCSGGDVMLESMMVPTPVLSPPTHGASGFGHGHTHHGHVPAPVFTPSVRSESAPPSPNAQAPSIRIQPRISAPRLVPTPSNGSAGQHLGRPRSPAPLSDPNSNQNGQFNSPATPAPIPDSVPDAFSDPFGDDEVHVRRFQPIKPSAYQTEVVAPKSSRSSKRRSVSSSSRQQPLSPSYRSSSRRSASLR